MSVYWFNINDFINISECVRYHNTLSFISVINLFGTIGYLYVFEIHMNIENLIKRIADVKYITRSNKRGDNLAAAVAVKCGRPRINYERD